jgi:GNAT superfamily N-acetyltransferase
MNGCLAEESIVDVRPAAAHDAERIAALMIQLGYEVQARQLAARLERRSDRREIFVAVSNERILGWASVCTDEHFVTGFGAQLEGLVVDDRARSTGIGARLLAAAEAWARERGCAEMRVQSNVVRERAHIFYERCGYATIKTQHQLRKPLLEPHGASIAVCRASKETDFAQLHALFIEYEADLPPELRHGRVPAAADLAASYVKRDAAFLASHEGKPIGCVGVRKRDDRTALVLRLFVKRHSRGHGAARLLLGATIRFAREAGFARLVLDTNKELLMPAYLLYRSFGFEECGPFAKVPYDAPTFMELRL